MLNFISIFVDSHDDDDNDDDDDEDNDDDDDDDDDGDGIESKGILVSGCDISKKYEDESGSCTSCKYMNCVYVIDMPPLGLG